MSETMTGMAECYNCRRLFTFSPARVPVAVVNGERHPVCAACVARLNEKRVAAGMEPVEILPGAYEPMSAYEEWE